MARRTSIDFVLETLLVSLILDKSASSIIIIANWTGCFIIRLTNLLYISHLSRFRHISKADNFPGHSVIFVSSLRPFCRLAVSSPAVSFSASSGFLTLKRVSYHGYDIIHSNVRKLVLIHVSLTVLSVLIYSITIRFPTLVRLYKYTASSSSTSLSSIGADFLYNVLSCFLNGLSQASGLDLECKLWFRSIRSSDKLIQYILDIIICRIQWYYCPVEFFPTYVYPIQNLLDKVIQWL